MNRTHAPWTDAEVIGLTAWQECGWVHPFTCPRQDAHGGETILTATVDGWRCPACDYTQDWAHTWMLKGPPSSPFDQMKAR